LPEAKLVSLEEKMKYEILEPNWEGMFRHCVQLVKDELPKDHGRDYVVEMLEFGMRLEKANREHECETPNEA